ncbi:copper homeostasis protein CutC, partial [Burkholderia pseudomallei]|nr:copper homeostasis protein CutC [Burkholderia pseudomallei]
AATYRMRRSDRAFDVARDLNAAFDTLLCVQSVTPVLPPGVHPSVLDARDDVARMVRRAPGPARTVLARAGLTVEALGECAAAPGVRAVRSGSGGRVRNKV